MYSIKYYTFELYPWGGGGAAKQCLVAEEGMLDLSFYTLLWISLHVPVRVWCIKHLTYK